MTTLSSEISNPKSSKMKKHQACFHLNAIAEDYREDIQRLEDEDGATQYDPQAPNKRRASTDEEKARMLQWAAERIKQLKLKLEAIDIAAEGLTK